MPFFLFVDAAAASDDEEIGNNEVPTMPLNSSVIKIVDIRSLQKPAVIVISDSEDEAETKAKEPAVDEGQDQSASNGSLSDMSVIGNNEQHQDGFASNGSVNGNLPKTPVDTAEPVTGPSSGL